MTPDPQDRPMWDSRHMIGKVHERFMELTRKEYDWRSFYNGWLEGRFSMLGEIKDNELSAYREADEWGKKFGDDAIPGFIRARISQLERKMKESPRSTKL